MSSTRDAEKLQVTERALLWKLYEQPDVPLQEVLDSPSPMKSLRAHLNRQTFIDNECKTAYAFAAVTSAASAILAIFSMLKSK